ncbi:hypothetical protein CH304_18660 [Rhodococcus sp. 15-649-1-2]|nr:MULTISPECIES: hypothetical protein [unclassified Rhodococcus (in: high G+C Gram-positive bacteria)]OZC84455.1 hypothetical protein CH282_15055 [Rhodococcus sp. 06-418-1B]OZE79569.1 hypothetical protein CH304_18660 [Rhodococcus sp. 15-649-1-2]
MSSDGDSLTYWQSLAVAADAGDLYLNQDAARACSASCDEYIKKLLNHRDEAKQLGDVTGWGDFDMGKQIAQVFSQKAVGGENNMVDVLEGHIEVVRQMQAVFKKFFTDTVARDEETASSFEGPR